MSPSEFWKMTPTELWWLIAAHRPQKEGYAGGMSHAEVVELYEENYPDDA